MLSSPESYLATAELSTSKMLYVLKVHTAIIPESLDKVEIAFFSPWASRADKPVLLLKKLVIHEAEPQISESDG